MGRYSTVSPLTPILLSNPVVSQDTLTCTVGPSRLGRFETLVVQTPSNGFCYTSDRTLPLLSPFMSFLSTNGFSLPPDFTKSYVSPFFSSFLPCLYLPSIMLVSRVLFLGVNSESRCTWFPFIVFLQYSSLIITRNH